MEKINEFTNWCNYAISEGLPLGAAYKKQQNNENLTLDSFRDKLKLELVNLKYRQQKMGRGKYYYSIFNNNEEPLITLYDNQLFAGKFSIQDPAVSNKETSNIMTTNQFQPSNIPNSYEKILPVLLSTPNLQERRISNETILSPINYPMNYPRMNYSQIPLQNPNMNPNIVVKQERVELDTNLLPNKKFL